MVISPKAPERSVRKTLSGLEGVAQELNCDHEFEQVHKIKQTCPSPNMMILNGQRTKNIAITESMSSRETNQNEAEPKAARPSDLPHPHFTDRGSDPQSREP